MKAKNHALKVFFKIHQLYKFLNNYLKTSDDLYIDNNNNRLTEIYSRRIKLFMKTYYYENMSIYL
jgi:hypothetical protein